MQAYRYSARGFCAIGATTRYEATRQVIIGMMIFTCEFITADEIRCHCHQPLVNIESGSCTLLSRVQKHSGVCLPFRRREDVSCSYLIRSRYVWPRETEHDKSERSQPVEKPRSETEQVDKVAYVADQNQKRRENSLGRRNQRIQCTFAVDSKQSRPIDRFTEFLIECPTGKNAS